MTRAIVLTLTVCTTLVWAVPLDPTTPPPNLPPALTLAPGGTPDIELAPVGTSRRADPAEVDWATVGGPGQEIPEESTSLPLHDPIPDWGIDKLIAELNANPTHGKLSVDVAPNGDIYVAVLAPTADEDTIHHFRSTNGGASWQAFGRVRFSEVRDFVLRVGSDAGGIWVYTFVAAVDGLVVRRTRPDGSAYAWRWIVVGDSITRVAADRNIETPQHLFCAYGTTIGSIRMVSSSDSAQTWGNARYVATNGARPAVAAGGDGYVYINWLPEPESTFYWVGRYTNNLISPSMVFNRPDSVATHRFRETSVAAARTAPGGSQVAIVLNTVRHTTNDNHAPRYAWTTNGGVSWTASFWPPTNIARETWRARGPYIRGPYDSPNFRGIVTMPEATTNFDSLVYAVATPANPTNWTLRDVHNDHRATGEFGAQVDGSSQTNGGFIVYRQYGSPRIWFDGWNWTGLEENGSPVPVADPVTLPFGRSEVRLNLDRPTPVRVTLYDGAGREVAKLHDGMLDAGEHNLPVPTGRLTRGIYFANVDIGGARHTAKLLITD